MSRISRRHFIHQSIVSAAATGLAPAFTGCRTTPLPVHARVLGANDDIRVAVIGLNGRGAGHISSLRKIPGVRLVALCDADAQVLEAAAKSFSDRNQPVKTYQDVRKLLEDDSIDAISTATPNHWHALISIWACQAGKDVYVEKPVSHNVWEGRKVVEAARKYGRIVQGGTQSRSDLAMQEAIGWIGAGNLGRIKVARGLCYKRRPSIGKVSAAQPVPATVDYDLWCGPAPMDPIRRQRFHYDWHWFWNYGNGDLGNQGIHQMDICRWALGKNQLAPQVLSVGGRLGYDDSAETPNSQFVVHDYGDSLLIFEVRGLPGEPGSDQMDRYRGQSVGHVIECEGGYLAGTTAYDPKGQQIRVFTERGGEGHHENWIRAIRSRRVSDLNADILKTHLSSALCHTGNISFRLGQKAKRIPLREMIKCSPPCMETLHRLEDHLSANEVSLDASPLTLGASLRLDPVTERFTGDPEANLLLSRDYRAPFVVPRKV